MKKILQINTVVNYGSTGRIAEEIGQIVKYKGWESYIAFGRLVRPSQSSLIKIGNSLDIFLHGLKTRFFDMHGLGSSLATRKLIHEIEVINPDIVHLHNLHGYYLNIEILLDYLKRVNMPIVVTLHDCWTFTGHCTHFDFIGCNKWQIECKNCPQTKKYPSSYFLDRSRKNFQLKKNLFNSLENVTFIPVSNWLNQLFQKSFLAHFRSKVINNGIDLNIFNYKPNFEETRLKYKLGNKHVLLGVASVWDTRKGLFDFLELSYLIKEDSLIVLVGLTKKQVKGLPKNIIGIDRTENVVALAELYSVATLFLNLTYEDNFPTTNLEALACGTPVLTYNTGGSPEAISEDTGFIVNKGDLDTVLKVIDEVKHRGKQSYLSKCRFRANNMYNKFDRYKDYIQLYNSLLNKE